MISLTEQQARERITGLAASDRSRPFLLGITGPPGAGKSTFAESACAPVLPMDGYHLANEHLDRLGLRQRKGAPATFDVGGFVCALARLRNGENIMVPRFDRTIDSAIAGSILLPGDVGLILTEGNYLLHDRDGWQDVQPLLDEVWFVDTDNDLRRNRLIHRHRLFGRTSTEASTWETAVDEPNAAIIHATRHRADAIITLS
jgi:pantothenate kinase